MTASSTATAHCLAELPTLGDVMAWLETHPAHCTLPLVTALHHMVETTLNQDTARAHHLAQCALQVAERVADADREHARMLAEWALGNALTLTATVHAVLGYYERARERAAQRQDRLALARLSCNIGSRLCRLGRYPEALESLTQAQALLRDDDPPDDHIAIAQHTGILYDCLGESTAALDAYAQAAAYARAAGHTPRLLEILCNTAFVLEQRGDLTQAEATYQEALTLAHQHQHTINAGKIAMNLGVLYTAQGRLAAAQAMLRQAYACFVQQGDAGDAACVQCYQAALARTLGLAGEAVTLAQQAVTTLTALEWQEDRALALTELLRAQGQHQRHTAAATTLATALAIWEQLGQPLRIGELLGERALLALLRRRSHDALADARAAQAHFAASPESRPLWVARARLVEAHVLARTGRHAAAAHIYDDLIAQAVACGDHWTRQDALLGAGRLAAATGQVARAIHCVDQAATAVEQVRRTLTAEELKARFLEQQSAVYAALVSLHATRGVADATLAAVLRAKGGGLLDLLHAERTTHTLTAEEQADLEQLRHHLAWARFQMSQGDAHVPTDQPPVHEHIQEAEQRLLTLLRQRQAQGALPDLATTLTSAQVARHLPRASALLEYYLADTTLWGLMLHADGRCDLRMLGTWSAEDDDLLADLDVLMAAVVAKSPAARAAVPPDPASVQHRLQRLWQRLIAPWGTLPPHLLIAPHGALGSVPFAALWDGHHYLGDTHTLALLPSGALLTVPPPDPQERAAVGAPLVLGYSDGGRLPATLHEAALVADLLPGACVYTEAAAASSVLRSLPSPPAVLHIAAHAALRSDAPLFSTVRLSDGDMALETWYDLPLRGTRLAVLSACETGRVADQGGPLLAFQGALLGAGVRTLVCTLWQASDDATAALMAHFYRAWRAGASPAAALQQAQRVVRADPTLAHPALWAPVICCGPGAHEADS